VPTIAEAGFTDFDISAWFAIMARADVPAAIIARLNLEIAQILSSSETQEKLLSYGLDPSPLRSTKEFADFLQADMRRWSKLAKEAQLTPQ